MTDSLSVSAMEEARDALARHGSRAAAARALGIPVTTFKHRIEIANEKLRPAAKFTVAELPDDELPTEDIIAHRRKVFERKNTAADARKLIPVTMRERGPIGICFFGDIHIDDDGCNWPKLEADMKSVLETEGMFAVSIGDLQNGWIGRLSRKWADQSITGKQAWRLVQWWIEAMSEKLLFIVEGNHDAWCRGVNNVSLIDWVMAFQPGISESDGVRVKLNLPVGDPIIINARHDFSGRSQFNPAHGVTKAVLMGYRDDDIAIAGHTHVSGYNPVKNPATGKVTHPIRVASYKAHDDYASQRGFLDGCISESVVCIIDPHEPDKRHRIFVEHSVSRAAKILTHMRADWRARK